MRIPSALLALTLALPASAATLSDASFFDSSDTVINFDALTDRQEFSTAGGVTFSAESAGNRGRTETDAADATGRFDDSFTAYTLASVGGGGMPTSGSVYAAGDFEVPNVRNVADMRFDFMPGVTAAGMFVIDNDFSDARLTAFDAAGALIDSLFIAEVAEGGVTFAGIDGEGTDIAYMILDGAGGAALDSTFIDDLTFRIAPVPLPATWGLMALGLAGFAAMRRRSRPA
jgi:hypothetical protein